MTYISFFLFLFGLVFLIYSFLFFKKLFAKKIKPKLPKQLKIELKKEQQRQQKSFAINEVNKLSAKKNKLLMEERRVKAMKDTNFDLFYEEEKALHNERLIFKNKSKWKGKVYYQNRNGRIFVFNKEGKKVYKDKV